MRTNLIGLAILLLAAQVSSIARAPTPYCNSKLIVKQFPIASEELLVVDTANWFSGYNLDVKLGSNNSWAAVSKKVNMLDQKNQYFPNIISHYVEPKDNSVGRDSFLLYKDLTGTIMISYGIIRDKNQLPAANSTAIVTTDKDVVCFDAALFLDQGLAIVDCAKKGTSIFTTYKNYFYFIDLTNHSVKKIIQNDLYVGFKSITKRKMMKFTHPQAGGFTYLLRSYFSDGVDAANSDNTYMQVFSVPVQDPLAIQTLRVIDRTFLNLNALRIMDAELYLDDIFVLDYDTGLFRLDILQSQRIAITARYRDFGFLRFGVFSDDLQNELIIALSNKHSVYEIDWRDINKPLLINKYSLMENSNIKNVFLNDRYLIVQSSADAYNSTNPKFQIDYTWVFTKGSRTYLNAYYTIEHNSSIVQVDFDRENSHLYIADERGLTLREVTDSNLILHYINETYYGKSEDVVIFADSYDPNSDKTFRCQQKFTALFVSKDNMTIFPTGLDPTDVYSVNYPNPLEIPLSPYFVGPNLQYTVLSHKGDELPSSWINKLNKTEIKINPKPTLDTVFFHTDVVHEIGNDVVLYYYQDSANNTHVAECQSFWATATMNCDVVRAYNHTSRIRAFASSYFRDEEGWNYYYSIVFDGQSKVIHIYDFLKQQLIAEITYMGDYDAEVTMIASSNGYIYALRKYAKTIDVYSLAKCAEFSTCKPDFSITYATLKGLGIRYFSPWSIVTDSQHPQVLFIKCLGSLIILDIDNKQKIHLLDQIISPPTGIQNYQVAVSKNRMLISAYPDHLYEYSLERLYTFNMVTLVKTLSTYGMTLQPNADTEFSDFDGTVYVNAVDPVKNVSVVMIYKLGLAASHALYATVTLDKLYSRPGFQIEVSGYYVNYMTIVTGNVYQVYRVFTDPFLTIFETASDFSFKVQAYNKNNTLLTKQISVAVSNLKQEINATKQFNETNGLLTATKSGNYEWADRQWFTGSVVNYNYTCDECNNAEDSKVKIREHIDNFNDLHIGGYFYTQTLVGGLSVWDDLFIYRSNGSVYHIVNLPDQKQLQRCIRVASAQHQVFAVTACQQLGRGINLYVTSFTSFKAFTWGPYYSDAYNVRALQIINDVLMVADTPANPEYLFQPGAIYLYRLSFNTESGDEMDELQIIDSNDFVGCSGWDQDTAYLGNAHMVYSTNAQAYRLYITEARYGFFVVDFVKAHVSDAEITILTTSYVNVKKLLEDNNLHMPIDACFLAVSFVKAQYNPHFDIENVVVTTKGYDSFEITIVYDDDTNRIVSTILHRVYQRYSFYNAVNELQSRGGFIVMGYVLPPNIDPNLKFRKQYITLYDSFDYPHESEKGYSEHYMIGAIPLNETSPAMFAINTTYDFASNGTRSGIVVSIPVTRRLIGASIAHNITLSLNKGYKSQDIKIKAYNDFYTFNFNATVVAQPDDNKEESVIIIIIIILSAIVFVFFLFYIFSVARKRRQPTEERQSLITANESVARESAIQGEIYQPPSEEMRRASDEEEQEEEEQEEKEQAEHREEEVPAPKAEVLTSAETGSVEPNSVVVPEQANAEVEKENVEA